ncbi:hypothetical protein JCM5353_004745 [Sporobolomyces roseus]
MLSQLALTLASALLLTASSSSAAPLNRLETRTPPNFCSPDISAHYTTAIAPTGDLDYAWTIFENDNGCVTNVSIMSHVQRSAHDIYEGIKYNNNFIISQNNASWDQLPEYRLTSAVVDGVQECIAAVSETEIRSAPCDSDLAAWTLRCRTCDTSLYGNGERCTIQSTKFQTCAVVDSKGLISLEECIAVGDLPPDNEDPFYDIPIKDLEGNQSWRIL